MRRRARSLRTSREYTCKKALKFDDELISCPDELIKLYRSQLWIEEYGMVKFNDPENSEEFNEEM